MKADSLVAHSQNGSGCYHSLRDHTLGVAALARRFAAAFGASDLGFAAGLLHDLGKASPAFQRYLTTGLKVGPFIDHKSVGARLAREKLWQPLAFPLAGHHGGLKSIEDVRKLIEESDPSFQHLAAEVLRSFEQNLPQLDFAPLEKLAPLDLELFLRFIFSALVDADFLDTESHFSPEKAVIREHSYNLAGLAKMLEASQAEVSGKSGSLVNRERHRIYQACLRAAALPQGFFRLTVPTGGGKTRSAMAFALEHALVHGLDRVVVAIPYTSIIDQTADVYRGVFGPDNVLEHHSSAAWSEQDDERADGRSWSRLASENWDAPIVATTNVQLFQGLLGCKPSHCRKLHNVARGVLVLDEVQTLPASLLDPYLDVLRQLVHRYSVTVVFCTATQPAYEAHPLYRGLPITEIVPDTGDLFRALSRVSYEFPRESWDWPAVAEIMRSESQALAVVNTKRDALALLDALDDPEALHLSTLLCGAHRRRTIAQVKDRLARSAPCRLVSTQVIEAGVDIDFPVVLRAVGPLDRIVQAAGRCNREGRLPGRGRVVVFTPAEASALPGGEYSSATLVSQMVIREPGFDPQAPDSVRRYFSLLFGTLNTDTGRVQDARRRFDYPRVALESRLIRDDSVPLVVSYRHEADGLLGELRKPAVYRAHNILRRLQPYIVNVYPHQFRRLANTNLITEVFPGLFTWNGRYHTVRGLDVEQSLADLLVP